MKYFLFLSTLALISLVYGETNDCYTSCDTDTTYGWNPCEGYGYTSCWQCNNGWSDLCIADCGWFYVTDCDSCDCGSVSTAGVCVLVFSFISCLLCCIACGRNRRRRYYARNAGMNAPLRSAPPVAAVGVITTTTPGIISYNIIYPEELIIPKSYAIMRCIACI